jgi:hypothetical protein
VRALDNEVIVPVLEKTSSAPDMISSYEVSVGRLTKRLGDIDQEE